MTLAALDGARLSIGWDDGPRRRWPALWISFPPTVAPARVRATMHRLAAEVDEASAETEAWTTTVVFRSLADQRILGPGGYIVVRLASYREADVPAEIARATAVFEAVIARHRR